MSLEKRDYYPEKNIDTNTRVKFFDRVISAPEKIKKESGLEKIRIRKITDLPSFLEGDLDVDFKKLDREKRKELIMILRELTDGKSPSFVTGIHAFAKNKFHSNHGYYDRFEPDTYCYKYLFNDYMEKFRKLNEEHCKKLDENVGKPGYHNLLKQKVDTIIPNVKYKDTMYGSIINYKFGSKQQPVMTQQFLSVPHSFQKMSQYIFFIDHNPRLKKYSDSIFDNMEDILPDVMGLKSEVYTDLKFNKSDKWFYEGGNKYPKKLLPLEKIELDKLITKIECLKEFFKKLETDPNERKKFLEAKPYPDAKEYMFSYSDDFDKSNWKEYYDQVGEVDKEVVQKEGGYLSLAKIINFLKKEYPISYHRKVITEQGEEKEIEVDFYTGEFLTWGRRIQMLLNNLITLWAITNEVPLQAHPDGVIPILDHPDLPFPPRIANLASGLISLKHKKVIFFE